jgi:hypothetical protein
VAEFAGMTMSLGNSLAVNFVIDTAKLHGDGHMAIIMKQYADGTDPVAMVVPQSEWQVYSGSLYYITYAGVKAKEMTDPFSISIVDSQYRIVVQNYTRTIEDYCLGQIQKYEKPQSFDAKRLALYVDILKYGAAAQDYFDDYHMDELATAKLTPEQLAYGTQDAETTDIRQKGEGYLGSTLLLQNEILLNFVFSQEIVEQAAYAQVCYTHYDGSDGTQWIMAYQFVPYGEIGQYVTVPGLKMADYRQEVEITLLDWDGNELSVCRDSVGAYIERMKNADPVYDAVNKLGKSAYAYFQK